MRCADGKFRLPVTSGRTCRAASPACLQDCLPRRIRLAGMGQDREDHMTSPHPDAFGPRNSPAARSPSRPWLIWLERRLLALWQDRYGPNRVGPFGLLQVVADMIKIFMKEDWIPPFADKPVFVLAPAIIVVTVLMSFAVLPVAPGIIVADLNIGLLFFLAMSSLGVYSVVLAGWSSNNKYSLLGGIARRRADAELRSLHGPVADGSRAAGRIVQPLGTSSKRSGTSGLSFHSSSASSCF